MVALNTGNADEVAQVTKKLLEPFPDDEVKVKPARVSGNRALALHYIDSRCVMDRLDAVVGIDGWRDEYTVLPSGEVECRLSVRIAGQWVTKADVGGQSEQPDEGDRMKAAYSDALKRAAVKFGVGRFLYRLPQTWMDYDPVKKCIVRPTNGKPSGPPKPAATQQQRPAAPPPAEKDNPVLRAKIVQALAQCPDAAEYDRIRGKVVADLASLSAADRTAVRTALDETKARLDLPAK